jgi:hypothetical protein
MPLRGAPETRLKHSYLTIVNILNFEPREISTLRFAIQASQKRENRKMSMDTRQKQPAVIEFLLLEKRPDDEIAIRLRNKYEGVAGSRATVSRWISKIRSGHPELQSDKPPGKSLDTRRIWIFERFSNITHSRHCAGNPRRWGFLPKLFGYICCELAMF